MKITALFFAAALLPVSAAAGVDGAARAAAALVAESPSGAEALFDKSFFRQISLEKLNGVFSGLYRAHGPVKEVLLVSSRPASGHFFFDTARGWRVPAAVSVDPAGGGITGLFFGAPYRKDATLAGVKGRLSALPGRKGLLARRLGEKPEVLESLAADDHFAVGSVFKLYVLGAMLRQRVPWHRVFRLREEAKSLPSGRLQGWPDGAPLTAHTLAALMISESDNTAADLLAEAVGRRRIEGSLPALGHSDPGKMTPFLKTSELFRLRADTGRSLKYLNLPDGEKYAFLARLGREPLETAPPARSPFGLDRLEWLASPADICRLMDFFVSAGDGTALELLALNTGLVIPEGAFLYAGYKGGSEPGVLSMAWLLKNRKSEWFCLAASWNDEKGDLEEEKFFGLMRDAMSALAAQGQAGPGGPAAVPLQALDKGLP